VDIGLRHLRILLVVAESGSISRAATRLKIAQPGLTAQLKRIEKRLGGPVFLRRPDGVVPTDLGAHVLGRSREILDEFSDLMSTAMALSQSAQPPGAVGLGGVDNPWVPVIAAILKDRLPHHEQMTYLESSSQAVLELLYAEKIGLAVIIEFPDVLPPTLNELSVRSLGTEPVLIGMSPQHRLAHRPVIKLGDLAEDDWIAPGDRSDGLGLSLRVACARAGFNPRFRYFGPDQATAAAIVSAGHAVGAFPAPGCPMSGLVLKRLSDGQLWRRTSLAWRADSPLAEIAEDIHAEALAAGGPR
jgi:DNA-binding transcriptional LysR family regulator